MVYFVHTFTRSIDTGVGYSFKISLNVINHPHNMYDITTRLEKASKETFYLVSIHSCDDILKKCYVILGSTGNVYLVTVSKILCCTCPDYKRHELLCKHILHILVVLGKMDANILKNKITNFIGHTIANLFF